MRGIGLDTFWHCVASDFFLFWDVSLLNFEAHAANGIGNYILCVDFDFELRELPESVSHILAVIEEVLRDGC